MSSLRLDPALTTRTQITRVTPEVVTGARQISSATVHEAAGRAGALPHAIKPVASGFRLCGPAVTVQCPGGDNLWIHRALYVAQAGDVLVVHVSGQYEHGYWGEVMSTAAQCRGLGGLVIDGCVRDGALLAAVGLPVFARGLCVRGTGKDAGARGWINAPTLFEDVVVKAGDLVIGDGDGVVCVPRDQAAEVVAKARARDELESRICQRLVEGESTLQIYGWD